MSDNLLTIYRVENEKRVGPYQGKHSPHFDYWAETKHNATNGRPGPLDDIPEWMNVILLGLRRRYVFGFLYLEQLHAWFTEKELDNLRQLGYDIKQYKVNEENILLGDHQVAFFRED